jgi:hypothetical protein
LKFFLLDQTQRRFAARWRDHLVAAMNRRDHSRVIVISGAELMKAASLLCATFAGGIALAGLSGCGSSQSLNLANPVVKGDHSTISGDEKATRMQQTQPE